MRGWRVLAVVSAGALALLGWAVGRGRHASPMLLVSPGSPGEPPPDAEGEALGVALAVASLPPPEIDRLRGLFAQLAERIEARGNPFLVDLEDGDLEAPLEGELKRLLPTVTATQALARSTVTTPGLSVQLVSACPAREACFAAWNHPTSDPLQRRARALAWPIAFAAVVRAPAGELQPVKQRLQTAAARADGRIAAVFVRQDWAKDAAALQGEAARLARLLGTSNTRAAQFIRAVAHPAPSPLPLVPLQRDEILIAPRLSALALMRAFHDEIEGELTPDSEWIVDPAR